MSTSILFDIGTETGRIQTANSKMKKKEVKLFVERELPTLQKKYKFVSRLATLVYNPHNTPIEKAWFQIPKNILAIKEVLSRPEFNCIYALLTVETHTASHPKKKSKKAKQESETSSSSEQDTQEVTLNGYPHIHIAIAINAPKGRLPPAEKMAQELFKATSFGDDIHVDETSIIKKGKNRNSLKQKDNENILCYCLKDSNHKDTYDILKLALSHSQQKEEIASKSTCDNTILFNFSQEDDISEFFYQITRRGCIISLPEFSTSSSSSQPNEDKLQPADTSSKFSVTLSMVIACMIDNNLRKYNEDVFQLKPGTRRTWIKWGTMDRVFGNLCKKENTDILLDIINNKPKIEQLASYKDQNIVPSLELDWNFVEFKDFYLHLPSFSILTSELPEDKHLALHVPDYSLEDLQKGLLDPAELEPQFWLSSISNQKFAQDQDRLEEFFERYYKSFLPLIQKDKVLTLLGVPNSGKTTVLHPYSRVFPSFGLTQFSDGQFANSNMLGKRLILADDTKSKTLNNLDALTIFEGNKILIADRKHKDALQFVYEGNIVLGANQLPDEWCNNDLDTFDTPSRLIKSQKEIIEAINAGLKRFDLKPEIEARLAIFIFGTQIKNYKPGFMEKMTNLEIGKVLLFTGSYYARLFLHRSNPLIISDAYDPAYIQLCSDHERIFARASLC